MSKIFAAIFALLIVFGIAFFWSFAFIVMAKCLVELILGYEIISFAMCAAIAVVIAAIKMVF